MENSLHVLLLRYVSMNIPCTKTTFKYYHELIIMVRESIQHAIGMCKMSA